MESIVKITKERLSQPEQLLLVNIIFQSCSDRTFAVVFLSLHSDKSAA